MAVSILQAGQSFPEITLNTLHNTTINIAKPIEGYDWKMVVVYRGKHCPLCTKYLQELNQLLPDFNQLGIDVIAISADSAERATNQLAEVKPSYDVGYGLTIEQMQQLGLYISGPRNGMNVESAFAEPAIFVINETGNLQIIDVSNAPFARPPLASMLMGLKYYRNLTEAFPINGTYA